MIHALKIRSEYYNSVKRGLKRAEIRLNDRDYKVGDILVLHEWCEGKFTGKAVSKKVIDLQKLDEIGLKNWVLLSIK